MTKIKKTLIPICFMLCMLFALALTGCRKEYSYYVGGSYEYAIDKRSSNFPGVVTSTFKVKVPEYGEYELSVVIEATIKSSTTGKTRTETSRHHCTVRAYEETEELEHLITVTSSFDKESAADAVVSARLVSIKPYTGTSSYEGGKKDYSYAIGFGVAGGVVLIGLTVVFILDKTGVLYKRK